MSQGRYPLLRLDFASQEQKTIYVRVKSRTPLRVPLGVWTEEAYDSAAFTEYLFLGLFFGALLFLIVYSLLTWQILRQRAYLYYILTIAGVGALQLGYSGLFPGVTIL